eukprot:symbB.v1.2.023003.t1/scaffold2078.1/size90238/2
MRRLAKSADAASGWSRVVRNAAPVRIFQNAEEMLLDVREAEESSVKDPCLLVLHGLRFAHNVGAALRCSQLLGAQGTLLLGGVAEEALRFEEALRISMAWRHQWRLRVCPLRATEMLNVLESCKHHGYKRICVETEAWSEENKHETLTKLGGMVNGYTEEGIETLSRLVKRVLGRMEVCLHDLSVIAKLKPCQLRARLSSVVLFSEEGDTEPMKTRRLRVGMASLSMAPPPLQEEIVPEEENMEQPMVQQDIEFDAGEVMVLSTRGQESASAAAGAGDPWGNGRFFFHPVILTHHALDLERNSRADCSFLGSVMDIGLKRSLNID